MTAAEEQSTATVVAAAGVERINPEHVDWDFCINVIVGVDPDHVDRTLHIILS